MTKHDVIVIGAGPAGLAMAAELHELGVKDVVVLEREAHAGGVIRHCNHWGFGWESHRKLMRGPAFAKSLIAAAKHIDIRTSTTVLEFTLRGSLRVHTSAGISEMTASKIILATGTRETSRAARLVGGNRITGIMNTGTLQQLVYFKNQKPFERPAIIGNEWVTYSALMTCKHAAIKPVGIFAEEHKLDTPWFFPWGAKLNFGVATQKGCKLIAIHGTEKVEAIEVEQRGTRQLISCDGVILSGKFKAETALTDGHTIDVVKIGNVRGKVNTAGRCVVEARAAAQELANEFR